MHPGAELEWRDLATLRPSERLREVLLPLPWLLAECLAAQYQLWPAAFLASFYFYLTGLRLVHDCFHGNLGLPRRGTDVVLLGMSVLMLGSMHAVRLTHLRHHRECLGDGDVEGSVAHRSAWGAVWRGPAFPLQLHSAAIRLANSGQLRWVRAEIVLNVLWTGVALGSGHPILVYHVCAMIAGQMLSGFFAVWTVHHDCDRWQQIARTLRHRLKSAVAFDMFYHLEHHLYPRVPTCHLPALAERLDAAAPGFARKQVY